MEPGFSPIELAVIIAIPGRSETISVAALPFIVVKFLELNWVTPQGRKDQYKR